jgi:hypothetical protein
MPGSREIQSEERVLSCDTTNALQIEFQAVLMLQSEGT